MAGTGEVWFTGTSTDLEERNELRSDASGTELTIEPGITIRSVDMGGRVGNPDHPLVLQGHVLAETNGATIQVRGNAITRQR